MVSLKTQIAGFSFDNCLMNAAGVSCMTVEELEAVRQSSAGTFITKTATLTGIGGQYIKPTALANVHSFYQRLDPSIQVIGTGGVYSGRDAFEHILCGASMVQIGTAPHQQGVDIFERVSLELKAIMAQKGYEKLEDFKGKLKYLA